MVSYCLLAKASNIAMHILFLLTSKEPPSFVDNSDSSKLNSTFDRDNTVFVKTVNEYEDFTLKCLAKGKPKPKVTWFLKYLNGTFIRMFCLDFLIIWGDIGLIFFRFLAEIMSKFLTRFSRVNGVNPFPNPKSWLNKMYEDLKRSYNQFSEHFSSSKNHLESCKNWLS